MKLLTWLGILAILSLILAACGSPAKQIVVPEFVAALVEEPAEELVGEAAVGDHGTDSEIILNASPRVTLSSSVNEVTNETETRLAKRRTVRTIISTEAVAEGETAEVEMMQAESIFEIAEKDGNFTALVDGLEVAGLANTLSGAGEFTIFAPTDDAFAALTMSTIDSLSGDPDGALKNVLLYHVVDGVVMAEDLIGLTAVSTMAGQDVGVSVVGDGQIFLNGYSQVIITDIVASNGVIHVIDEVLVPAGRG